MLTRRQFSAALLAGGLPAPARPALTLGFSTYGMPRMPTEKSLSLLAEIGFDAVELAILPDRDAAPARLGGMRRKEIRKHLDDRGLVLSALMENLTPSPKARVHAEALERLRLAAGLAHDLAPTAVPLVETVLGGGAWDKVRNLYRDRLGDWVRLLASRKVVLAIKPHRFGAMTLPEHAVWLIRQLNDTPWLRLAYDHSHYDLRGLDVATVVRSAEGCTAFVAVKDVALKGGKAVFLLPGETGAFDHANLFTLLHAAGYRGDVNCEVSGMVSGKKDYDPVTAAKICHRNMARALEKAGVRKKR